MANEDWKKNPVLIEFRDKLGYVDYDHKYFKEDLKRSYEDVGKALQHEMNLDIEHPGMENDTAATDIQGLAVHMLFKMGTRKSVKCGEEFAKMMMKNKATHYDKVKMMKEATEILIGKMNDEDYVEGDIISQLECYITCTTQNKKIEKQDLITCLERCLNIFKWMKDVNVDELKKAGVDEMKFAPLFTAFSLLNDDGNKKSTKKEDKSNG